MSYTQNFSEGLTPNQIRMLEVRSYRKKYRRKRKLHMLRPYSFEDVAKACRYSPNGLRKKLKRLNVDINVYYLTLTELVDFINIYKREQKE